MKGPLSPHLRRPYPLLGREPVPSVTTSPEARKGKAQKSRWWRRWRFRKKYPWLILIFLFGPSLASLYAAYTETPVYRAEVTLLASPPQNHSLSGYRQVDPSFHGPGADDDKTQYELLKNHHLVSLVIREQGLASTPVLSGEQTDEQEPATAGPVDNTAEVKAQAIAEYLNNLDIVPVAETRLVKVAFLAADPQLAARIANAHVEAYLRQSKEQGQTTAGQTASFTLVDKAVPPLKPARSRRHSLLMVGGLVGLLLGGGLLSCLRRFDSTVKAPADVTRYLKLASLGVVPDFSSKELRAEGSMPLPSQFESFPGVFPKELLLSYHPLSLVPEAYRNLRAELLLSRPAGPPRSLLVTSALSGEGKTLTALNTAIALAQMGTRVLVIDADLRHPQCHAVLKTPKGLGLTEFLTGQRDLAEVIQATRVDRLFFLSGGAIPPNPAELLGAKKMQAALSFLNHLYDYIVVDSPPLGLVSDALLLSSLVDGVVLVVNSQTTHYKAIQDAAARLDRVRAKVLGVVLNKVDAQSREYAEYYRRYRAYYRQSGANEEVVSVVDPKKRGESVSHGRTSPTKNGRKSPAKAKVGVEPRLLGVASASLPKEKEARAALVNDGSRENLSAVISSTQPHSRPTDTESTELPGQSEGREETILSPGIVDKKDDSLALVASDIDGSGIEVSQGDSSEVTDPDVVQSS